MLPLSSSGMERCAGRKGGGLNGASKKSKSNVGLQRRPAPENRNPSRAGLTGWKRTSAPPVSPCPPFRQPLETERKINWRQGPFISRRRGLPLDVEVRQVVPVQAQSADGWLLFGTSVRSGPIAATNPGWKRVVSLHGGRTGGRHAAYPHDSTMRRQSCILAGVPSTLPGAELFRNTSLSSQGRMDSLLTGPPRGG